MPNVSVIIPVYNVEQYIERCARSLFGQTLDDIEYIFVNDCTPDKSMEVLARVLEDYPARKEQVRIIDMPVNSGQAKVRKVGVEASTGDYVIHCDSDDWVDITMYEKMWKMAVEGNFDMVICGNYYTDGTHTLRINSNECNGFKSLRRAIISDEIRNYLWNKLIRRDMYKHVEEWPVCNLWEDAAIVCQIAYHSESIGKIDEPLYHYCTNPNGICASLKNTEIVKQARGNFNIILKHIRNYGEEKEFRKEFTHRKCLAKVKTWTLPWLEYLSFFPEVNLKLFFEPDLPLEKKLGHLSKCLGIHGISTHNLKNATLHRAAASSEQRDEALKKLHGELYTILAEILRVCDVLGLHPFLQGGSAIGAFFDKGIIPWDDDIDVGLVREEYEIFMTKAQEIISDGFFVQSIISEPNMLMASLLKVRKDGTFFSEECWDDVPLHHGIFVDIMPYDKVPDNQNLQKCQRFLANKLENAISNHSLWKYWFKRRLVTDSFDNFIYSLKSCIWYCFFSKKLACNWYDKASSAFNNSKKIKCSYYNQVRQKRDHIAVESVHNPELVSFGPLQASVPGDVETYLKHHYPNLRRTIPENERESHMPKRIDFSDGTSFLSEATPELSVILPVFNAEQYLRESIDSVLCQTFKDFELIIINDGSTDSSEQIIQSYTDNRIVYLKNDVNLKLIATLNRGIDAARGKYIARIDADDRCHPARFEKQVEFLNSHEDIGLCGSWANLIDLNGEKIGRLKNASDSSLLSCLLFFTCPLLHPSVMGKASVFKDNRYDFGALHVEDFELWNRLARKGVRLANIRDHLIDYRWHDSNISAINKTAQYESKLDILQPQVSELLGRDVSRDEMQLHFFSFNLYSKNHKCTDDSPAAKLPAQKAWLLELSAANLKKGIFPETDFNAVLLSRWLVCCIACGKCSQLLSLPARFYRLRTLRKAVLLLIQK